MVSGSADGVTLQTEPEMERDWLVGSTHEKKERKSPQLCVH
jgi:hypothetical protein